MIPAKDKKKKKVERIPTKCNISKSSWNTQVHMRGRVRARVSGFNNQRTTEDPPWESERANRSGIERLKWNNIQ